MPRALALVADALGTFAAAARASAAVRAHRMPAAADLRRLNIAAADLRAIDF